MGRPLNPPPYTEQPSLPPREGPPPPYCSVENLVGPSEREREGFRDPGLPGYTSNPDHHEPSSASEGQGQSHSRQGQGQRQILAREGHEHEQEHQQRSIQNGEHSAANASERESESRQERQNAAELDENAAVSEPLLTSRGESSSQ